MRSVVLATTIGLALAAVGAESILGESSKRESRLGPRLLEGSEGVEVCLLAKAETLRALQSGQSRLVLILSEYAPTKSGLQALSVTTSGGREQVLAVVPTAAFSREETESHRRFLLAPQQRAIKLGPGEPICVSVAFYSSDGSGSARLELDIWAPSRSIAEVESAADLRVVQDPRRP